MVKKVKRNAKQLQKSIKSKRHVKNDVASTNHASVPTFPPNLVPLKHCNHSGCYTPPSKIVILHPSSVFLVRNFLEKSDCERWVNQVEENIGFEVVSHSATRDYAHRQCGRIQCEDWVIADRLYEKMRPILKEITSQISIKHTNPTYRHMGCNGNVRIYKYEKGMSFGRHYDGSNIIPCYPNGCTEITVLIYLSSCEGGTTRFYPPQSTGMGSKRQTKKSAGLEQKSGIAFVPEIGSILLHVHGDKCLLHEADPVLRGSKYVLRTDIVYGTGNRIN